MTEHDDKAQPAGWEKELLQRFAFASLKEQRAARRWGIFFKLLFVGYLVTALLLVRTDIKAPGAAKGDEFVALVDLKGVIADDQPAAADTVARGLRDAFEDKGTRAVILRINSPGGSPVQSGYINDEIRRLRGEYPSVPLYAVIQDIGASGGYYVAVAADAIYADKASIVGSIGVRMDGFGFTGTMDKLGVERRLMTAGENKAFLDPFSPVNPAHVEHIQGVLAEVHAQFIDVVKANRGDKLAADDELFSGYVWTGAQAVELGLIDGLASPGQVARDIVGLDTVVDFTPKRSVLERLSESVSAKVGAQLAEALVPTLRATP